MQASDAAGGVDSSSKVALYSLGTVASYECCQQVILQSGFLPRLQVLQCVAVLYSVVQCVAVYCSVLQCGAVCCSVLQCIAVCCSVLQCVAVYCSVLQCIAA